MGLMDYNARYYSPTLGRFISPDTIVPDPGDAKSYDRYAYVNNNPVNGKDSTGHCVEPVTAAICIGLTALAIGEAVMLTDYLVQRVKGHDEYSGFGSFVDRSKGGLTEYIRDRGAVVLGVNTLTSAFGQALTTTAGATMLGFSQTEGPLLQGPIQVGLANAGINTTGTFIEGELLNEPATSSSLGVSALTGGISGMMSGSLDATIRDSTTAFKQAEKNALGKEINPNFPSIVPIPTLGDYVDLEATQFTTFVSKSMDYLLEVTRRLFP